jgi:hypothetical protein
MVDGPPAVVSVNSIGDRRPAVLLRHLKNVALLTPYFRRRSATATPLSASFRIPTIWISLNFDFRMTAPNAEQST